MRVHEALDLRRPHPGVVCDEPGRFERDWPVAQMERLDPALGSGRQQEGDRDQ